MMHNKYNRSAGKNKHMYFKDYIKGEIIGRYSNIIMEL